MKPADTVFKRAVARFKSVSPHEQQRLDEFRSAYVRNLAIQFLKDRGVVLIGHPSLVEYAIAEASVLMAEVHKAGLEGKRVRKRGRPLTDPVTVNIYIAAHAIFHQESVSVAAAAKQAAKFLGEPATKDRVEKGRKRWLAEASAWLVATNGGDITRQFLASVVGSNMNELKRIAAELKADQAAEAARRRSARFAPFIGAAPTRSLPRSK